MNARIDALFAPWDRPDSPGCAVAVLREGRVMHARGYGMADLELDVPITPAMVFHVASISKQFTGFLVHLLAREGKLLLGADIRTYVPEVPKFGARITLRHLLHHTSGLRDQNTMVKLAGWRPMDERTERDILELVRRQTTLNFPPGESFNYCNTGYLLLGLAVSRVSGERFRDCVATRVFRPLDMHASVVRDDHMQLVQGRARGYTPGPDRRPALWLPNFDYAGSTSVHTTVEDLLRWADNVAHPRIGVEAIRQLTTSGTLTDGQSVHYGAGVEIGSYRGLDVVKHSGWDLGYTGHLAAYPSERFAVAILANVSTFTPELLARRVADICLADRFPERLPAPVDLSEAKLRAKVGLYRHPETHRANWIHLVKGVLRLSADREPSSGQALQPLDDTTFRGENETTEVVVDGATLTVRQATGVEQRLEATDPWKPSVRSLAEYAATYRSPELDSTITFRLIDGHLVGERRKWPACRTSAAYRDAFTDDIATYVFVRNRAGRIVAVVLTLDRIYHLRFDRVVETAPRRRRRRR